jgi:hypothetical protein
MMAVLGITRSQDFILGAGDQLRLSRDFMDGCCTWDFGSRTHDMLSGSSPVEYISIRVTMTLSNMSGRLSVAVIS